MSRLRRSPDLDTETITPERAAEYLRVNVNNRKIRPLRVKTIASDIAAGKWQWNGQPIIFDTEGLLIDGQHRLTACVQAGKPIVTDVRRNVPRSCMSTIDIGTPRTTADLLIGKGRTSANERASTIKKLLAFRAGVQLHDSVMNQQIHRDDVSEFDDRVGDSLDPHIAWGSQVNARIGGTRAVWAMFSYEVTSRFGDDAEPFLVGVRDGELLAKGDARLALRTLFIKLQPKKPAERTAQIQILAICDAWNLWASNKQTSTLRVRQAHDRQYRELISPTPQAKETHNHD